jgi:hypothetical protein
MALDDYPTTTVNWDTGLSSRMLQLLGNLAVVSAQTEQLLHQIYWHHLGLTDKTGPIVTDNLNPKKLEEDILKIVSVDKEKANIYADLKILFTELRDLNTKRNHCLHWIWIGLAKPGPLPIANLVTGEIVKSTPFKLQRPVYRQSGGQPLQEFAVEDVKDYCNRFAWLSYRLRSHSFSDDELRKKREETLGNVAAPGRPETTIKFADLFWPAPWLDKPLPPDSMPHNPPEIQK